MTGRSGSMLFNGFIFLWGMVGITTPRGKVRQLSVVF